MKAQEGTILKTCHRPRHKPCAVVRLQPDYSLSRLRSMLLLAANALLAILLLAAPERADAELTASVDTIPESGIEADIRSPFSGAPESGFLPLHVTIKNHSTQAREWLLSISIVRSGRRSATLRFEQRLAVTPSSERRFELMVPLSNHSTEMSGTSNYASVTLTGELQGYGIRASHLHWMLYPYEYRKTTLPFVLLSPELHLRSWPVLAEYAGTTEHLLYGGAATLWDLPRDWRAYTGLSYFFLTADEFRGLEPEVHQAILHWVSLGGRLKIFHVGSVPTVEVNYGPFSVTPTSDRKYLFGYGTGTVTFGTWDGKELGKGVVDELISEAADAPPIYRLPKRSQALRSDTSLADRIRSISEWELMKKIPKAEVSRIFLGVLVLTLIGYSVLVGPVNLFILAHRGARMMLFLTTPLLSIAATALLVFVLVLREGVGGWGMRSIGVLLVPEAQVAFVTQEQLSHTALLFDTSFPIIDGSYLLPIELPKEAEAGQRFAATSNRASGEWFSNRSRQAQLLHYATPTRAQLEVQRNAAGTPSHVFSSINVVLEEAYIGDERGKFYRARNISPGTRVALEPVSKEEFRNWHSRRLTPMSALLVAKQLLVWGAEPNCFLAVTKQPTEFAQQTLAAITWRESQTVFYGSYLPLSLSPLTDGYRRLEAAR